MGGLQEQNELVLFSLFKEGKQAAFDEIFNRYWEKLYEYAFHRTQSKDAAFEIVQDIFTSLWTRKETVELQKSLSGYLFAAVRFQIIHHIKSSKLAEHYLKDYLRHCAQADNSNEESVLVQDLQQALGRAIAELPARCQEVARLSLTENRSVEQIAAHMHVSPRTVENQLALARRHLRLSLGDFLLLCLLFKCSA